MFTSHIKMIDGVRLTRTTMATAMTIATMKTKRMKHRNNHNDNNNNNSNNEVGQAQKGEAKRKKFPRGRHRFCPKLREDASNKKNT